MAEDFTLGADPEFVCVDKTGRMVRSDDVVSDEEGAEIGCDGNHKAFEVRPAPSKNPLQVVANIHDIFVRQSIEEPRFLDLNWHAGSFKADLPIGGHVHFGVPANRVDHQCCATHMDTYLGLVSLLLEDRDGGYKRRNGRDYQYGLPGDDKLRQQPWGFEYRVMSSWLSSPYVSAALLCLSKALMWEMLNNQQFKWHKFACKSYFADMRQDKVLEKFPTIWEDITKLQLYQAFKPYIDLIYFLVKNRLTWFPSAMSMRESWGVVNMQPCLTNKVGMDIIWGRYNHAIA